jgi:asparagine synthase (glutamine-hydrolysing)
VTALAGFWATNSGSDPSRACERILTAQAVYAPAAPAQVTLGDVAVGRRLFALLPEDRFDRGPVTGGGGRWTMVADVRLDNRADLAEALRLPASEAARLSDAAIVMRAVERWEEGAVARLVGDFALAIWDKDAERLVLARDFLGARPLHFHRLARGFAFASMAKGLHALPEVPRAPDEQALKHHLALAPRTGTRTFFAGIERVPPGHLCLVTRSGVEIRRFWSPTPTMLRLKRPEDYADAVREQFDRAVAARLRRLGKDLGAHLSGGLDSTAVTATAARQLAPGARLFAFTSVPGEDVGDKVPFGRFADEGAHAAAVAALYPNVDHVLVRGEGRSPLAALDRNAFLFEQPVLNLCNGVWIDAINDAARARSLSVLLTGQMGNMTLSYEGFERLPALLRRGRLLQLAREAIGLRRHGLRLESIAAQAVGPFLPASWWMAINRWRGRRSGLASYSAIAPAAAEAIRAEAAAAGFDPSYRPPTDAFQARLRALGRVDHGCHNKGVLGGWGIDCRDPTGDRRLVELCLSIPPDQYLRGGRTRALARDAFADRLPAAVRDEPRKGLQAADWHVGLRGAAAELREEVERVASVSVAGELIDVARLRSLASDLPSRGWNSHRTQAAYRLALLRAVSAGHFVRKTLGKN